MLDRSCGACRRKVCFSLEVIAGLSSVLRDLGCQSLSQTYAVETQTFVLHATTVIGPKGIESMGTSQSMLMNSPGGGFSAVIGPDGRVLSEPLESKAEGLVIADVDPSLAIMAQSFLDICGLYGRPDLLWLGWELLNRAPGTV